MPTPIQEEPSSGDRYRAPFIAETPSTNRISRIPGTGLSGVAETPPVGRVVESLEPEDDLGDLMVMTDEEDDEDDNVDEDGGYRHSGTVHSGLVPETPLR